jgi:hypothetical protein
VPVATLWPVLTPPAPAISIAIDTITGVVTIIAPQITIVGKVVILGTLQIKAEPFTTTII